MTKPTHTVLVAGAGLAGSTLAIDLAMRGYDVHVVEKRPRIEPQGAGRSINLALSHRGLIALERIGLRSVAEAMSIPMRGRMMHDSAGKQSFHPYSHSSDNAILSISRGGLTNTIRGAAEKFENVTINYGTTLTQIDWVNQSVRLKHSGTTRTIAPNKLVGCDGAGSVVRRSMQDHNLTTATSDLLPHGYKELTIQPTPSGDFALDPGALHIWPREQFMLIALPNVDKTFTATLFMPLKGPISFDAINTIDDMRTLFRTHFPDALPLMREFDDETESNPVGTLGTVRCDPWHVTDYSILLGDAAHAVVPFFGQGMNASLEDCTVFADKLDTTGDWATAAEYMSTHRRVDANSIADMALENYIEMRDSISNPEFQKRRIFELALEKRLENHFRSRYSMVSFSSVPYSAARRIGKAQEELVTDLMVRHDDPADLTSADWIELQEILITDRFQPDL